MATASVTISGGASLTTPFARTVGLSIGPGIAIGSVAWNTSTAARKKVDWLPRADTPVLNANGTMSRSWYLFFKELAETRLGGVNGSTVTEVATTVTQTQAAVTDATNYAVALGQYARSIAASTESLATVAEANALTGASSVPDISGPPTPPGTGTR